MKGFSLTRIAAVLVKEFTQLRRDRITYAMILVMPLMQLLLFGYAINTDPRHLPAAVVSHDHGRFANALVATLERTSYVDVRHLPASEDEMDGLLRRGEISLALTIPPDFTQRVLKGDRAQILAEVDATDPTAAGGVATAVASLPANALRQELKGVAAKPTNAPPFEVVVHRLYNPEGITSYNIVPGLLAIILSMTLVMMTAMAVTREVERGTMESLLSMPATAFEVMIGKLLPYVAVGILQTIVVLTLARLLFAVPMAHTLAGWVALSTGIVLFITGNLALGYCISTVVRSQLQAMQISMFYMMPSLFLSGFMFPFQGLPGWAQVIGEVIPITHFLRIIRGSLLKGQVLADMGTDLVALCGFLIVVTVLTIARSRTTLD
ncbi:ABC transporter permease [Sphingobium naphthae]|uniref:ABC transporter permease n=1 Tax=Sphingobium naphthae TaxID=1886786 RepID=A0ABU4A120_9SPHN|nr:ABC transporter permease [Sphingobium naphthae]MDV5825432.1 ABC transporter permease [Sphingobium naphthae]